MPSRIAQPCHSFSNSMVNLVLIQNITYILWMSWRIWVIMVSPKWIYKNTSTTHMFCFYLRNKNVSILALTPCGVGKLFVIFMRRGHIRAAGRLLISYINQLQNTFWEFLKIVGIVFSSFGTVNISTMKLLPLLWVQRMNLLVLRIMTLAYLKLTDYVIGYFFMTIKIQILIHGFITLSSV